jgi:subtilisin family serine protease
VGVNWNVGLMALKFLDAQGNGFASDAIECLEYAIRMRAEFGIDVRLTSSSWGGGGFDAALRDAIASGRAGMLFVAAAGSSASDNDGAFPAFPAS